VEQIDDRMLLSQKLPGDRNRYRSQLSERLRAIHKEQTMQ